MNLKIPSCQKNMCFSGNLTTTSPKKFASPCYVFGGGILDSPSQNPSHAPKSRTFSFSPKGLEPWGTRVPGL